MTWQERMATSRAVLEQTATNNNNCIYALPRGGGDPCSAREGKVHDGHAQKINSEATGGASKARCNLSPPSVSQACQLHVCEKTLLGGLLGKGCPGRSQKSCPQSAPVRNRSGKSCFQKVPMQKRSGNLVPERPSAKPLRKILLPKGPNAKPLRKSCPRSAPARKRSGNPASKRKRTSAKPLRKLSLFALMRSGAGFPEQFRIRAGFPAQFRTSAKPLRKSCGARRRRRMS